MPTPINNTAFVTSLADIISRFHAGAIDEAAMVGELQTLVDNWTDETTSTTLLGTKLSEVLGNWNSFTSGQLDWLTVAADGGPHGDGTVDLVDYLGNVSTVPSLTKLISQTAKGDPGQDGGIPFTFDNATADAAPAAGGLRFNAATPAATTELFVADTLAAGGDVSAWLDSLDDSTSTPHSLLYLRQGDDFAVFGVTGAVVAAAGYHKVPVAHLASSGAFTGGASLVLADSRSGDKGDKGDKGDAATVAVGAVTTGAAGSAASVTDSGAPGAAILDFTIPRGDKGDKGDKGDAATVAVGTVTTVAPGDPAAVTDSGTPGAAVFDFDIPQGDTGESGPAAWQAAAPWATGVNYTATDPKSVVTQGGSTYVCKTDHLSTTFAADLANWTLVAQKGADGNGTGNVNPSGTITAGHVAVFADGTGNLIQDGGAIGGANGVASLDGAGKVPTSQLPATVVGALEYQGTWNALTNTPTLPLAAAANKGWYYKVATAGSSNIDGNADWQIGDWIVSNGATWDKIDNTDQVVSVAGLQGAITALALKTALALVKADVGLGNVDNTAVLGPQRLWIGAGAIKPRSTNGATSGSLETTTNKANYDTLDFDPSTPQYGQVLWHMPKSWDGGTITFIPVWRHGATTTNFGVSWGLSGVALGDGVSLDAAQGAKVYVNDVGGVTDTDYDGAVSAAVTIAGAPAGGKAVLFEIGRKADDAVNDTLAVAASLLGFVLIINTAAGNDA